MNIRIPVAEPEIGAKEEEYVLDCVRSNWVSSKGKYISEFESRFAEYIGVDNAIAVSNGTTGLHLALLALNVGFGDEVIVPTFTYVATANAVKYVNATPVFVDSEADTWNMDVNQVKQKISSKTKAIIAVHIYGQPVDMDALVRVCKENSIYLIEDVAEAIGSEYQGKRLDRLAMYQFSVFGNKTIPTGEGGMVLTNNSVMTDKLRKLRNQGMSTQKRYWYDVIGYNYRMTNIQAAIGLAQMERIDYFVKKKRQIAEWYKKYLNKPYIEFSVERPCTKNTYWMSSILLKPPLDMYRDILMEKLIEDYGIETRPFFYPMHKLPIYLVDNNDNAFPIVESFYYRGLNLPSSTKLEEDDIKYISRCIIEELDKLLYYPLQK